MLDELYAGTQADVTPGQYVLLAVSDTGIGMPAEIIEQAFEPFSPPSRKATVPAWA